MYKDILKNLISHGKAQNDPIVIEISLKLASVYARMGNKKLALTGYQWCSNTCQKSIEEMKNDNQSDEGEHQALIILS